MTLVWILLIDLLFLAVIGGLLVIPALLRPALFAVLKRNFIAYFSSATGYVFLSAFVFLTSAAQFYWEELYVSNVANLAPLTQWFPLIMLIFVPAITMSIWSDERRLGTDELILTLPAGDFDIVLGKYLAAALIFTVSLLFAQLSHFLVLVILTFGELDLSQLFSTYFGYWLIGLAMIAIGMTASFLTRNVTVAFVLGALFNLPLVIVSFADAIFPPVVAYRFEAWGISAQLEEFGRGVISLASIAYFALLIALFLYICMVLIGRRHWLGGSDGTSMLGHYMLRIVAITAAVIGLNVLLQFGDSEYSRLDATTNKINSISPASRKLIRELAAEREKSRQKKGDDARALPAIHIEAFISSNVPRDYVNTRRELISLLKEFESMADADIHVTIHDNVSVKGKLIKQAEERYGIKPERVQTRSRGAIAEEEIVIGAVFRSGREEVVVPFFDYGTPVEYEIVRSIVTVTEGDRKKLGVIVTDVDLFGSLGEDAAREEERIPAQAIIEELSKQYVVEKVEIDPAQPIAVDNYDALLVVQPSSLGPPQLNRLVEAIEAGAPTAIFEDPFPWLFRVEGTSEPKMPSQQAMQQAMMFGQMPQPIPKGDMETLWDALDLRMLGKTENESGSPFAQGPTYQVDLLWQQYNPYPKLRLPFMDEFVFIREEAPGADEPFNPKDPITSGIDEVLFLFPGALKQDEGDDDERDNLEFTRLIETGTHAGTISAKMWRENARDLDDLRAAQGGPSDNAPFAVAARIQGHYDDAGKDDASGKDKKKEKLLDVIYVADIDVLNSEFMRLRNQRNDDVTFQLENVTFVLNVIDALAGEDRFLEIRKRKPSYHRLLRIEDRITQADREVQDERDRAYDRMRKKKEDYDKEREKYQENVQEIAEQLSKEEEDGNEIDYARWRAKLQLSRQQLELARKRADKDVEELEGEMKADIDRLEDEAEGDVESLITGFQLWPVLIPPLLPFCVGICVFVWQMLREREGVSRRRLI